MSKPSKHITYRHLLYFFLPLGATPFLIASTHSMMNAALARLPLPELSLAIFTVVKSLTNAIKAPDLMARQTAVSLIDDRVSFHTVMKFVWGLCGVLLSVLFLLSFTPAGGWVLRNIIGLSDPEHIVLAYTAMRITCFLPIVESLRNGIQGLAIGLERTKIMPVGTATRFIVVLLFLGWAVSAQTVSGLVAASLTWTAGIGIEGILIVGYLVKRFGSLSGAAERMPHRNEARLTMFDVMKFFAPLGLMMSLMAWIQPMIQSGLARSISPTRSLAAYGVAWGVVLVITGPISLLHQCSLVYTQGTDDPNWPRVKRFSLIVGAVVAALTFAVAVTPVGYWLLHRVIAAPAPIAQAALPTLAAFSLFPLIRAWRETYWGVLMHQRSTSMIGGAKVANLLAVGGVLLLAFGPIQAGLLVPPAVVAALAYTLGEGIESIVIWRYAVDRTTQPRKLAAKCSA